MKFLSSRICKIIIVCKSYLVLFVDIKLCCIVIKVYVMEVLFEIKFSFSF